MLELPSQVLSLKIIPCAYRNAIRLTARVLVKYTPFQLSDLVLKFFKISLAWVIGNFGLHIQIQHPNFSLIANFHDLNANEFNFMRITNLKIYKGFDRE